MGKQILHDRVISPELPSRTGDNTIKILIPLLLLLFLVDFFPKLYRACLCVCVQPNNEGNK